MAHRSGQLAYPATNKWCGGVGKNKPNDLGTSVRTKAEARVKTECKFAVARLEPNRESLSGFPAFGVPPNGPSLRMSKRHYLSATSNAALLLSLRWSCVPRGNVLGGPSPHGTGCHYTSLYTKLGNTIYTYINVCLCPHV